MKKSDNYYELHIKETEEFPFIYHHFGDVRFGQAAYANWHENIEMLYVVEGEGKIRCGCEEYSLKVGDIFVVNSNLTHDIYSESRIKYRCLIPDRNFCMYFGIDTSALQYKSIINDDKAQRLFERINIEKTDSKEFKKAAMMCAVIDLIVYLSQNYADNTGEKKKNSENIALAIGYIKSHLTEKVTLDEISSQIGLNKYYFAREFKRVTGYSLIEFINRLRIDYAKRMLSKEDAVIGETALKTGFTDFAYFSKIFKRYTGITPTEFVSYTSSKNNN